MSRGNLKIKIKSSVLYFLQLKFKGHCTCKLFELYNLLIQLINDNLDDVTGEVKQKCLQIRDETLKKMKI